MRYLLFILIMAVVPVLAKSTKNDISDTKWALIQQLLRESDIVSQIEGHFGPFEDFPKDKAAMKKEMEDEGMSPLEVSDRLRIMERYYQQTQAMKAPILSTILTKIGEFYNETLSEEELHDVILSFSNPAMKKFLKASKGYMPEIGERVNCEMKKMLKPAHDQMMSQLMQIEWRYGKGGKLEASVQ